MATRPAFTDIVEIGTVAIATANANRDGTGTIGTVFSASANGSKIKQVDIKATVTTTAGTVRLYIYTGTTYYLFYEQLIPAITASATVAAYQVTLYFSNLNLPTGYSLRASTERAENFNIIAYAGGY